MPVYEFVCKKCIDDMAKGEAEFGSRVCFFDIEMPISTLERYDSGEEHVVSQPLFKCCDCGGQLTKQISRPKTIRIN